MKQIRKRLTYANVMSSIAVFLVLGGATAFAADQLAKNSVGSKQLKANAVTTAKIKKDAVSAAKIKAKAVTAAKLGDSAVTVEKLGDNAVTTAKIADGAVTGAKVNAATLGTVPNASTAANLAGQTPFLIRLGFGQSQTIAGNGAVSLVASCAAEGGNDHARILMQTTQNGAVAGGNDDFDGSSPADFLNVDTPEADRVLVENSTTSGGTDVDSEIDQGFVLGPEGKLLSTNSEGIVLGLNYGAPGCLFGGIVNAIG